MGSPYTEVSIVNYNANPPADDGSATEANRVKWSTIKTKLNDPLEEAVEDINTNVAAAFDKIDGGITSTSISYQVLSTDQGKLVRASSSGITITTPDAAGVTSPFVFGFLNDSAGDITLDGSGSQTIDGDASVTVPAGAGGRLRTDGTNWFTEGQNFQRPIVEPQGFLTLLDPAVNSTLFVPTSDQAAKTSVFYRPFRGNLVPIPNGTSFLVREFSDLTLTLHANHLASSIYDLFVFDDSGTIRIGTGPAWSTPTAGSGARGSGAGTTAISALKGLFVNTVAMTARNGATTYSVGAGSGLYVGSIFMDGTNGQVTCHVTSGQARKWGVWNAWNRQPIMLQMTDSTSSWSTGPVSWRQSRADANNFLHLFSGLSEEPYDLAFQQTVQQSVNSTDCTADIGIGFNSTTTNTGRRGRAFFSLSTVAGSSSQTMNARHIAPPSLGIQKINAVEQAPTGTTGNVFFGAADFMMLSAKWRG